MYVLCIYVGVWMWLYILLRRRSWVRVIVLSVSLLETEAALWNNNPLRCIIIIKSGGMFIFFEFH